MLFECFWWEDELVKRFLPHGILAAIVEEVDSEAALHLDGRLAFAVIEHESSAEASLRGLTGSMEDIIRPDIDNFVGDLGFLFHAWPFGALGQIQAGAARHHERQDGQER